MEKVNGKIYNSKYYGVGISNRKRERLYEPVYYE